MPVAEELEDGDEIVGDLLGLRRYPRRDEQPLAPIAAKRAEEDADQLFGLEQRPTHRSIAPHRAVVAVERTGVRHEDSEKPHGPPGPAEHANVEGPQRAGVARVAEP